MTTLTQLKGLVRELGEYAENYHDVDCTGDPPRFVSNEWGEVLRMVGGLEALLRQLEREMQPRPRDPEALHPAYGLVDRFPHEREE